ncbi:hypothetical protein B0T20DRAFT_417304 [Sordaria brevicollis]|uniref:Uncharacterized protein n=1 Tax=Sordaria brevicollis TaxID=83679 RepID=A0AAE0PAI6_SORBR|nr:hypothetical protein B0T20DRAFT_417304 [Sordaria brevicollis]
MERSPVVGWYRLKRLRKTGEEDIQRVPSRKINKWYRKHGEVLFGVASKDRNPRTALFLTGFTHGPRPEDWEIFWDPSVEDYVEDFWRMIENPPLAIPGSWVD